MKSKYRMFTAITLLIISLAFVITGCGANERCENEADAQEETPYYDSYTASMEYIADVADISEETPEDGIYEPNDELPQEIRCHNPIETGYAHNEDKQYAASIPLDLAAYFFTRLCALFDADNGYLWGGPLHTPFIFLDLATRYIVANQPDPAGRFERRGNVYVGTLPTNLPAMYSFPNFNGQRWAVLPWDLIKWNVEHPENVLLTMAHMSFHVQQPSLFGSTPGWDNSHMDQKFPRITVQLEINALIHALQNEGDERLRAVSDALSIRAGRRAEYGRARYENIFEFHEGLADYTETRLLNIDMDILLVRLEARAYNLRHTTAIGGAFGYLSGALYAYLLDETGKPWRENIRYGADLGAMLKDALEIAELTPFEELDLVPYGYEEISAFEAERYEDHQRKLDEIAEAFAQEPTLRIPFSFEGGDMQVNPSRIFFVPSVGRVHGATVVVSGVFGRLEMYDGYFARHDVTQDGRIVATGMVIEGNMVYGPGWVLELRDNFEILPDGDNFVVGRV